MNLLGIKRADQLPPKRHTRRTKWDEAVSQMLEMEPGDVFEIEVDEGTDWRTARNRIVALVRRRLNVEDSGSDYWFCVRSTANGTLGIYCVEGPDDEPRDYIVDDEEDEN